VSFFTRWCLRPVTVCMVLGIFLALSFILLLDVRLGPSGGQGRISYAVIIKHFGVDPSRMERDITEPLENAISIIPGLDEISSVSEYSNSRVTLTVARNASPVEVYLHLRDAVDRVYSRLPSSVQKPVIVSSSLDKRPVFVVTFKSASLTRSDLSSFVEKEIKPAFERIDGAGEVEVGGGEVREIHVKVRPEKTAVSGLGIQDIATLIRTQDVLMPVGKLKAYTMDYPLSMQGRLKTIENVKKLTINIPDAGLRQLETIASVNYGIREQESTSRVDGENRVALYVQPSGSANLVMLSRLLRQETERWSKAGLEPEIILDSGKTIEDSILEVLKAMATGLLIVVVFLAVFSGNLRQIIVLALLMPLAGLVTTAFLSLLKISLDTFVLSGMAVGIGMIVDAGIVLTEAIKKEQGLSREQRLSSIKLIIPPLMSSTLTTLIVLMPLFFLGEMGGGINQVATAVGLLISFSLLITIFFIPPFYVSKKLKPQKQRKRKVRIPFFISPRKMIRLLYAATHLIAKRPLPFLLGGAVAMAITVAVVVNIGKDLSGISSIDTIFAHLEMDSGISVAATDKKASKVAAMVKGIAGVERVETISRRGNAEMNVRINPVLAGKSDVARQIKELGSLIPDVFIYLPESSTGQERKIEVALLGQDNQKLRELAKYTASVLDQESWTSQVVLHFKKGPPSWVLEVDQAKGFNAGLLSSDIANFLRWALHGPVAQKWIENNREIDLRVMSEREQVNSIENIKKLAIPLPDKNMVYVGQLGDFKEKEEESRIYRKNRQRAVFFTVHSDSLDLERAIAALWKTLATIKLPEGYGFDLDKDVLRLSQQLNTLWLVLGLALLLIFMVLASEAESLLSPLMVCSVVPLSLSFPIIALYLSGQSLTIPVLIGLIILSGIVVNNAILIADQIRERMGQSRYTRQNIAFPLVLSIRRRMRALLFTSVTTILGTLPLLLTQGKTPGLIATLSFIVFWGILGSVVTSIFFLPAIISLAPGLLKPFKLAVSKKK
jgi:multidrug efflux pump subunit AcrB